MLINQFLLLGAILFSIGVYGVLARKNAVLVLMSISSSSTRSTSTCWRSRPAIGRGGRGSERLRSTSSSLPPPRSVGLALVLLIYRNRRLIALDELSRDEGLSGPCGSSRTPG